MQLCRTIYYSIVSWLLYMFYARLSLPAAVMTVAGNDKRA
jgi:phage tail protein X